MTKKKPQVKKPTVIRSDKTLRRLKSSGKELPPGIETNAQELDTVMALEALMNTEGGTVLVDNLTKDIVSTIDVLASKYKTFQRDDFVSYCADLKSKLELLRSLTRAKRNRVVLEEVIAEALKE